MLCWLPSQGTYLLPLLSSSHGYILLIAGKLRRYDLFFFPYLGIHVNLANDLTHVLVFEVLCRQHHLTAFFSCIAERARSMVGQHSEVISCRARQFLS